MKRRVIALLLLVCILTAFTAHSKSVLAAETEFLTSDFSAEEEFMRLTIYSGTGVKITPTDSYYIQDASGNKTIVCVEFTHSNHVSGFGLIDLVDYTVTMIALDAEVPFDKNDTVIYGGVLSFAVLNDDGATATVLGSEKIVPADKLYDTSREGATVTSQSQRAEIIEAMEAALADGKQSRSTEPVQILVAGGNDPTLVYRAGGNSDTKGPRHPPGAFSHSSASGTTVRASSRVLPME